MRLALPLLTIPLLAGCAGVSVQQLNADLTAKPGTPKGAVYYLPKPYLLVAELPADTPLAGPVQTGDLGSTGTGSGGTGGSTGQPGGTARSGFDQDAPGADEDDKKTEGAGGAAAAPAGTDQSFLAQTKAYVVKLIYLPDMRRPLSISAHAGLFGQVSMAPVLQNGWMLTSLETSADSKMAEVLGSIASVISAVKTPGGGGGDGAKKEDAPGGGSGGAESRILRPGLYEFRYDLAGRLDGLCPVNFFGPEGVKIPASGEACTATP